MRRHGFYRVMLAVAGIAIMVFSGCRAPRPSFNFWAPFGLVVLRLRKPAATTQLPIIIPKKVHQRPVVHLLYRPRRPAFAPPPAGTTPVEPSNDFPIDSSSRSQGAGAVQSLEQVRVGKWRPPRHVPQVRPVSFEAAASSKTGCAPSGGHGSGGCGASKIPGRDRDASRT